MFMGIAVYHKNCHFKKGQNGVPRSVVFSLPKICIIIAFIVGFVPYDELGWTSRFYIGEVGRGYWKWVFITHPV